MRHLGLTTAAFALCWMASPQACAALKISAASTANVSCADGTCGATAPNAILNVDELAGMLTAGDVTVASGDQAQDIEIDGALHWASTHGLVLDSRRNLTIAKPVIVAGLGILTIMTEQGVYEFSGKGHVEFKHPRSGLVINGTRFRLLKDPTDIGRFYRNGIGYVALAQSIDASKYGTFSHPPVTRVWGTLEGLGNTITNFSIEDATDANVGFIGSTFVYSTVVRDLRLMHASISATGTGQNVGILLGLDDTFAGDEPNIRNCAVSGEVSAGQNAMAGGLVGASDGFDWIYRSRADVTVIGGDGSKAGGIIGSSYDGWTAYSYVAGSVHGGDGASVGGLVGSDAGPYFVSGIQYSYSRAAVSGGANASVGGLVGYQDEEDVNGGARIIASYSTGAVSGSLGSNVGGVIGYHTAPQLVGDAYWDLDTSGVPDPSRGSGNITSDPGITGLTTAAFTAGLPADFLKTEWKEKPGINDGYPYLLANVPQ